MDFIYREKYKKGFFDSVKWGDSMERNVILIVDDDIIGLNYLSTLLKEKGYKVETACNGVEALNLLRNRPNKYSCVLLDHIMPYMSGFELLIEMKLTAFLKQIPVIMLTSITDENFILESVRAGAHDYAIKPIEEPLLVDLVNSASAITAAA
jgi:CheY-like chemotaxis protein